MKQNADQRELHEDLFDSILDELGPEYSIYEDYSGRFMFGDRCVGIVGPYPQEILKVAKKHNLSGHSQDNLGLKYIVYWPHIRKLDMEFTPSKNDE